MIPLPNKLQRLPPGVNATSDGSGSWSIAVEGESIASFNQNTGFSIALNDGITTNVKADEIGNFQVGQDTPYLLLP
jgi:hypothetical protein